MALSCSIYSAGDINCRKSEVKAGSYNFMVEDSSVAETLLIRCSVLWGSAPEGALTAFGAGVWYQTPGEL